MLHAAQKFPLTFSISRSFSPDKKEREPGRSSTANIIRSGLPSPKRTDQKGSARFSPGQTTTCAMVITSKSDCDDEEVRARSPCIDIMTLTHNSRTIHTSASQMIEVCEGRGFLTHYSETGDLPDNEWELRHLEQPEMDCRIAVFLRSKKHSFFKIKLIK